MTCPVSNAHDTEDDILGLVSRNESFENLDTARLARAVQFPDSDRPFCVRRGLYASSV